MIPESGTVDELREAAFDACQPRWNECWWWRADDICGVIATPARGRIRLVFTTSALQFTPDEWQKEFARGWLRWT